jgi:tetratricopeptide (TPR) repeat protein
MATRRRPPRSRTSVRAKADAAARPRTIGWHTWLPAVVLVAAAAWAYSTSFSGAFVHDDTEAIAGNPHITSLWPIGRALSAPRDTTVAGRPVASLSLALNEALAPAGSRGVWTRNPALPRSQDPFYRHVWGYHAFNLAVHTLTALVLFGVVRRTLLTPPLRDRFGRAATPLALAIALVWVVHPLQTESVTYIVQRVESLMGLFYLTTVYCAIRVLDDGPRRRWWMTGAVAACALGMGAKEVMVSAPVFVALWIWICRPDVRTIGPATRPLLIGLASTWLLLAFLVASSARSESVGFGIGGWTWWSYLRTQAEVIVHYLRLAIVPWPQVFAYVWLPAESWIAAAPELAALTALALATLLAIAKRRPIGLLGAWFFLILAPTSSVVPIVTEVAAEHRMYLPVAGVIALVILGVYRLAARRAVRHATPAAGLTRHAPAAVAALAVLAVVIVYGNLTRARNLIYASSATLTADTVKHRPQNAEARLAHAVDLLRAQRFADAERHLRAALALPLPPGRSTVPTSHMHMYLGSALAGQGKTDEGVGHFERALALNPNLKEVHGLIGETLLGQGRVREAAASFERAVASLPNVPPVLTRAAWLLATATDDTVRNGMKAVQYAERAVHITRGQDVVALDTLAAAYAETGRFAEAVATAQAALIQARTSGQTSFIRELEQHAARFRAGRPVRDGR